MVGSGKRHKPPSRARYEAENPVVSIRVDKQTYASLNRLKEASGKSLGELVKEALAVKDFTPSLVYECWLCQRKFKQAASVFQICRRCYEPETVAEMARIFFEEVQPKG